uniref:Uncharacterized protein n=1 Tax=Ficedula albicollis TaxID=59894 RepID=A0A803W3Y4_FICAL
WFQRAKTLAQEWISRFCQDHLDPGTREVSIHHSCSLNAQLETHCPLLLGQSIPSCFTQQRILSLAKRTVSKSILSPHFTHCSVGWPRSPEANYTGLAFFELTKCTYQTTVEIMLIMTML